MDVSSNFPTNKKSGDKPTKSLSSRLFGKKQESIAAAYLKKQGLTLIQSNFQCRCGEIDLVMIDPSRQVVFVEVRYRSHLAYGTAVESIGPSKQRKIRRAAAQFLLNNPSISQLACRFDVIGISPPAESHSQHIEWIKSAFY